jgi:ribosomal protein S18 acetylase RimI-like enzyme
MRPDGVNIEIGIVQDDEAESLGELIVAAYNAIPGSMSDPEYDAEISDVRSRARQVPVLVARRSHRLLGGLTYVPEPGPFAELAEDGDAEIRMFAVARDAQGTGVGRLLVTHAIERARAEHRRRLVLSTSPWMVSAQRLYESRGFRRNPERDRTELSSGQRFELLAYQLALEGAE